MLKKTRSTLTRFFIFINVSLVAGLVTLSFAGDPQKKVAAGADGVAIRGYDTVAYFTENRATKGNPEFTHLWRDVKWYFANAEHQALFTANPERYAPQFGGFCALGVSKGKAVAADPEAWTIVEGKLYMKFNEDARDRWRKDKDKAIEKAEENWVELQQKE